MPRIMHLFLIAVICCTAMTAVGVDAAPDDPWVETALSREPLTPPGMPEPTGPPLKPLPRKGAKPAAVAVAAPRPKPPPVPPPTPRFDPAAPPALTLAYPLPGSPVNEGPQTLVWHTSGPIVQVKVTYGGQRCRLGGRSRGTFGGTIGKFANKGTTQWTVPWMDGPEFTVRLVGLSADGRELATDEREYPLRPRIVQDKPDNCIVVSKSLQRLYYLRDGLIRRMHIVSTAAAGYTTPRMKPGSYDRRRGAMGRVFGKQYAPVSRMYRVVMYYWLQITSSGSHGIHATTPRFYGRLGGPASHGCIRQHKSDAQALYELVPVGTPVYVQ